VTLHSGCVPTATYHQEFAFLMNAFVGRSADDPDVIFNRYSQYLVGSVDLEGGDREIVYNAKTGERGECLAIFRVDRETNKITGWRFEGTEDSCIHVP
ncbi:unnamed protein product, partial [Discosporangium mesarthrocarpum]